MPRNLVFLCYSRQDQAACDRFKHYLATYLADYEVKPWVDRDMPPGSMWEHEIPAAVADAIVAIVLVSMNSMESQYVRDVELPELLRREADKSLTLTWLALEECPLETITTMVDGQPRSLSSLSGLNDYRTGLGPSEKGALIAAAAALRDLVKRSLAERASSPRLTGELRVTLSSTAEASSRSAKMFRLWKDVSR